MQIYRYTDTEMIVMPNSSYLNRKICFLINDDTYLRYKIALLSLHRQDPGKYPANPSVAFRNLMNVTIEEYEKNGGKF